MTQLVAYLGTDPDLLSCYLQAVQGALASRESSQRQAFGIGFYNNGDVLLRKRPNVVGREIDWFEQTRDVVTDCFVGLRRPMPGGGGKPENTHPFKYRRWLFAHAGEVRRFPERRAALLAEIPEYLQRNIRGETDSEVLFHLFLTFLHHEGKLDDPNVDAAHLAELLRATVWRVDTLGDTSEGPSALNMAVTNGRTTAFVRHNGGAVFVQRCQGLRTCEALGVTDETPEDDTKARALRRFRGVMVAGELEQADASWEPVPEDSIVTVGRELNVTVRPL